MIRMVNPHLHPVLFLKRKKGLGEAANQNVTRENNLK